MTLPMLLAACLVLASTALAETALPVVRSTRPVVSLRIGSRYSPDGWQLSPATRPDVLEVPVERGQSVRVSFVTDVDSAAFEVRAGASFDLVIEHGADRCWTRVAGVPRVPMAVFDSTYRAAHRGRLAIEVPEVYELVNVALAMTATGIADSNLVYHRSAYYRDVRRWFEPERRHPAILALDSVLAGSPGRYMSLKMNGYAFEFGPGDRIVQSRVYDRTAFSGEVSNSLRPFMPLLESFAAASRFRTFYREHRATYERQIAFFRDSVDVRGMLEWLTRRFPDVRPYDSNKIVFSPLVAYNQSSTWLEADGFRELQAHVNFPYPGDLARRTAGAPLSAAATLLLRSDFVFTELNHGFINPEADRFGERAARAVRERDHWVDPARGQGYYGGVAAFNEYMNWALVSLRAVDLVPAEEAATLAGLVDRLMTQRRGFPRFAAFDAFLLELYRRRAPEGTISELYPAILEWFERDAATAGTRAR